MILIFRCFIKKIANSRYKRQQCKIRLNIWVKKFQKNKTYLKLFKRNRKGNDKI